MTFISTQSLEQSLDVAATRASLGKIKGKQYWRSLEELAESPAFEELLHNEFPRAAQALPNAVTRRQFVTLMGASLALAGLTGCAGLNKPTEKIVPYVRAPEYIVPGKPLFFATAMEIGGLAMGLLAENHEGRPTKLEGNPDHPASLGAIDILSQASILSLYDPDRSQAISSGGQIRNYDTFLGALREAVETQGGTEGAGLRILTEATSSPTLGRQLAEVLTAFPQARWHVHEPVGRANVREGATQAFGSALNTVYRFDEANIVLSLDADFFTHPYGTAMRYAREWSDRRRLWQSGAAEAAMNRLYVVESAYTITGSKADHRAALRATEVLPFAQALARALGVAGAEGGAAPEGLPGGWLDALIADLNANRGTSLVIAGENQPGIVHALAHAINGALGNVGTTVLYTDPLEATEAGEPGTLAELADDIAAGTVGVLVILGGNPVYASSADLRFGDRVAEVPFSVHLGLYQDETSERTTWHVPMAHFLETWSDARAYDGTVSIVQPLIAPLFEGRTAHELLASFSDNPLQASYDVVRQTWQERYTGLDGADPDFERFWRAALHDGVLPGTVLATRSAEVSGALGDGAAPTPAPAEGMVLQFRPDPSTYDGRFANNGWLQELPKPITKLTWDNAALMSPVTARALGVWNESVVNLAYRSGSLAAPVRVMPGHPDNAVTVTLGYGRQRAGRVGDGLGFNAFLLRSSDQPWADGGLTVTPAGDSYNMAVTQEHYNIVGEEILKANTLEGFREHPDFATAGHGPETEGEQDEEDHEEGLVHEPASFYPEWEYNGYKWGMAIDLTTCIGCNACVMACNAENNIIVVGKDEVARSREMHWLRVDTYFAGDDNEPENPVAAYHMPVPCMHCEKAPCEPVCPVAATVHDDEGLNNMVYNRCVGTRYCSNNCPYKVRRFNFLEYIDTELNDAPVLSLLRNPDVTVRTRGVMEKCSYCVQRISAARIEAQKERRSIADGEVLTACQAACPTRAILFGDLNNPEAEVVAAKSSPLNYSLLAELGTQPRTTYLAAVNNPNPALLSGSAEG